MELERQKGKNDGSIDGQRYFNCSRGYGVFVMVRKVALLNEEDKEKEEEEEVREGEEVREWEWRGEEEIFQRDEGEEEEEAYYFLKSETDLLCTTRSVKGLFLVSGIEDGVLPYSNDLHFYSPTHSITPPALPTIQETSPPRYPTSLPPPPPFPSIFTPSQCDHFPPGFCIRHLSVAVLNDEEEEGEKAREEEEEREEVWR